jgi:predicted dehydrogenase
MKPVSVGIVGCGSISETYLSNAKLFRCLAVTSCADLIAERACAKADRYGIRAVSVEELLADPGIEIVVNLTVPAAHYDVGQKILNAGKNLYSEKPLCTSVDQAQRLLRAAKRRGLRVGSAPDTFLGGGHQNARQLIDAGTIGRPIAGTAFVMSRGMEDWHPNPEFFFKPGGGPMLDMGVYYITVLVNLLGPVSRILASTAIHAKTRVVATGPVAGSRIDVDIPTTTFGVIEFENGSHVILGASWDVWRHKHEFIEIYGTEGSMILPDPNFFGGDVLVSQRGAEWRTVKSDGFALSENNSTDLGKRVADYRIVGVADLACAIRNHRPHRTGEDFIFHVLEVMEAFQQSADSGRHITIQSTCIKPHALCGVLDAIK